MNEEILEHAQKFLNSVNKDLPEGVLPIGEILNFTDGKICGHCIKFIDITEEEKEILRQIIK